MRSSLAFIVILLCTACVSHRIEKEQKKRLEDFGTTVPPGVIQVTNSLCYDEIEVTNFHWLEYMFWVERTFGAKSPEHLATLPDTSAWYGRVSRDTAMVINYLRHPAYRDYPVVGLTYAQAVAYSKWRSDRVMELYLIGAGIIPYREDQTSQDYFSIDRFYATDSLRAFHHLPYPSYDLPTFSEWQLALALSDSLARINLKHCNRLKVREYSDNKTIGTCSKTIKDDQFFINSKEHFGTRSWETEPIAQVECFACKKNLIWQIRGNVAELCKDTTLVLGGGWTDSLDSIMLDQPFPSRAPNAATGFRCVCWWRKWDSVRD